MLPALGVAFYYEEEHVRAWLMCIGFTGLLGFALHKNTRAPLELGYKEGFGVVGLSWLVIGLIGALPYLVSGVFSNVADAIFESMSGLTTTGASVLENIEALPKSLLFWRSFTHWLGGMGVIVLGIVVLPLLGVGGVQLFRAEAPGPSADKLTPRIASTAKILWEVYLLLTVLEVILLYVGGMPLFDSMWPHVWNACHWGLFRPKMVALGPTTAFTSKR